MAPLHTDTGTRVDLCAPRVPADVISLARELNNALARLHLVEQRCKAAEDALLFAEARVEFTMRGVMEAQGTIDDLRSKLEDARASLSLLAAAESFEAVTRNEGDGFEAQPTAVRTAGKEGG